MVWPMTVLRFERGTLLLEGFSGAPPPPFEFDPWVEAYCAPAISYTRVIRALRGQIRENWAPAYRLGLTPTPERAEYRIECVYVDLSLAVSKRLKVSRDDLGASPDPSLEGEARAQGGAGSSRGPSLTLEMLGKT